MSNPIAEAIQRSRGLTARLKQLDGLEIYGELMQAAAALQESLSEALILNATSAEDKLTLLDRVQRLTEENKDLKDWHAESREYQLEDLGYGCFVQSYKPTVEPSKPPHWACTNCFSNLKISILQNKLRSGFQCPSCKFELPGHLVGSKLPR
ncbi:hypothetical protein [Comamonas sp.]|uniref:hypothetical protein n=1 Tax=Comamonas sp. TaxID=34028 RepID=UPI0028AD1212|nr:hypothetical protein [Comamonas sp.]